MTNIEKIRTGLQPYPDEHERQAALAALAELERSAAEPVAWQARIGIGENWAAISASEYAALEACGKRQLRKLYAEPMPATKETK